MSEILQSRYRRQRRGVNALFGVGMAVQRLAGEQSSNDTI